MRPNEIDLSKETKERPIAPGASQAEEDAGDTEEQFSLLGVRPQDLAPKMTVKEKFYKQAHLAGKILRFSAKIPMELRHPSDVDQKFIISYYLADDTISVFCRSPLNSGLTSGQFLNRGYHINSATGKAFSSGDFYVGARLCFTNKTLEIDDVDDYSLAYTHLTISEIMALVRRKVEERNVNLHEAFSEIDEDHNAEISYEEFANAMMGRNLNLEELLTKRDMLTLFRHFDKNSNGSVSYSEVRSARERGHGEATMIRLLIAIASTASNKHPRSAFVATFIRLSPLHYSLSVSCNNSGSRSLCGDARLHWPRSARALYWRGHER